MKKFLKMFGAAGLLGAMLMAGGCGDDAADNTGYVVKGPVYGATGRYVDSTGKFLQKDGSFSATSTANDATFTTGASGQYNRNGYKVLISANGKYRNLAGTEVTNPAMAAPAGASNVSALTTLVANAATTAIADALKASIAKMGISFDTVYLVVPSAANAKALLALNESVGTMITAAATTAEITTMAANVNTLLTTNPPTTSATATDIATFFTTNAAAIVAGTTVPAATATTAAAQATIVNTLTPGTKISGSGSTSSAGN